MCPASIHPIAIALALLACSSAPIAARGQTAKEVNEQTQFWGSLNSTSRLTDRWGAVGDFHIRRNDFIEDPSFYLLRFGAHYWLSDTLALTLGYAHNWVAPAREDWRTWTEENRIYQQVQHSTRLGRVSVLHRLRNEQRWREEVQDDSLTGEHAFSDRVRYLVSLTIPVSERASIPSLVLSDEILIQFGPDIVTNTFDQNRLFAGIKKSLSRDWSFDLGYMLVHQQKASGYEYDLNHTLRWFFYFTPDLRKTKSTHDPAGSEE
ncbi:MAG TPA: DUF2490 domain-containing protein [Vicinamibacteria bacterium]|nr:DUF2490 domain-containing protein [Vicinamibacteria bacterium]